MASFTLALNWWCQVKKILCSSSISNQFWSLQLCFTAKDFFPVPESVFHSALYGWFYWRFKGMPSAVSSKNPVQTAIWSIMNNRTQPSRAGLLPRFLQPNKHLKWAHTPRSCPLFNIFPKNIDFATFRVGRRGTAALSNVNPLSIGWWEMRDRGHSVDNMTKPRLRGSPVEKPSSGQGKGQTETFVISSERERERGLDEVIEDTFAFRLQPIPSLALSNDVCVGASCPRWANQVIEMLFNNALGRSMLTMTVRKRIYSPLWITTLLGRENTLDDPISGSLLALRHYCRKIQSQLKGRFKILNSEHWWCFYGEYFVAYILFTNKCVKMSRDVKIKLLC